MAKREIIIGIYKIISPSGKIYIGQSKDIYNRWKCYHKPKKNVQTKLYNSFRKYGSKNHIFEIVQICEFSELNELEEKYVLEFDSVKNGLNARYGGGAKGKTTDETKEKLRLINTGKKYSDEVNKKKGRKGVKCTAKRRYRDDIPEEEMKIRKERWSGKNNPNYGNKLMTPEHKEKLIQSNLGKKQTDEQKKKTSERFKGIPKTEEQKKKMSLAAKGKKKSPEAIKKSADSRRGKKQSYERRRKTKK